MENLIKLIRVRIKNIKNVKYGIIDFKSHITGIYGQNGSGKTALVDSMNILKSYLYGRELNSFYELINVEDKTCNLNFIFEVKIAERKYKVFLDITLKKLKKIIENKEVNGVDIVKESIKYSELNLKHKMTKKVLIESTKKEVFRNKESFRKLFLNENEKINLMVIKRLAEKRSVSFLFTRELQEVFIRFREEYQEVIDILLSLKYFGESNLIVIRNENIGIINVEKKEKFLITAEKIVIDERLCNKIHMIIDLLNIVLPSIIPNMKLELFEKNREFVGNNKINIVYQLISIKDGRRIPFKNESEGIKKITSILISIVGIYYNKESCLVIDDLDSKIFEHLLGELLSILNTEIKGQLIFTSHNLRILEKLDKASFIFTTTNENNKYFRLKKLKENSNLRDMYIREITMQEQKELLCNEINIGDIEFSLYKASLL